MTSTRSRRVLTLTFLVAITAAAGPATTRPALTFRAVVTSTLGGDDGSAIVSAKGDWLRLDHGDGRVRVERYDSREALTLEPAGKVATVREFMTEPPTLLGLVRNPTAGAAIGERTIDEKRTRGVERPGDGVFRGGTIRIWSDVDTGRPARVEIFSPKKPDEAAVVIDRIEFDLPLDDALFSLAPPAGYKVEQAFGIRPERLRPAATTQEAATLTLVPRVGLGPARFDMTREQVVAALGEPDQADAARLMYFSRGLVLMMGGENALHAIHAFGKSRERSSASHDFPGQSDLGIRIGSTRADVIAKYGEPTEVTPRGDDQDLFYSPQWIRFQITADRVTGIWLLRPQPGQ